jgi:hypothetical protein
MARSVRVEFPGAFYHVMARGNRREPIFLDKEEHAITYAKERAWFRSGEIRVLDAAGHIESAIPFDETDRKL